MKKKALAGSSWKRAVKPDAKSVSIAAAGRATQSYPTGGKKAFTLAEVLLTLAIIGVVAALTIPAVITKVTRDQYVVALKKAYNTLKSAQREAEQEHGPTENWDWKLESEESFEKYFKPHFDILKDCGMAGDNSCFPTSIKALDQEQGYPVPWSYFEAYKFITSDGIAYVYWAPGPGSEVYPGRAAIIAVDVNGVKEPNMLGRDVFEFDIYTKAGIKPNGTLHEADETRALTSAEVDDKCLSPAGKGGYYCTAKVLAEGAMNY